LLIIVKSKFVSPHVLKWKPKQIFLNVMILHAYHLSILLDVTHRDVVTMCLVILTVVMFAGNRSCYIEVLITSQLTPWSTVLEKLIVSQLVKFPAFYEI
jgi:hypothetical protein